MYDCLQLVFVMEGTADGMSMTVLLTCEMRLKCSDYFLHGCTQCEGITVIAIAHPVYSDL